jgi:hypothetical protein
MHMYLCVYVVSTILKQVIVYLCMYICMYVDMGICIICLNINTYIGIRNGTGSLIIPWPHEVTVRCMKYARY